MHAQALGAQTTVDMQVHASQTHVGQLAWLLPGREQAHASAATPASAAAQPDDCVQAWDTLFWFAILVGMSGQLNSLGVIRLFSDAVGGKLAAWNLSWQAVFGILNVAYFVLHYAFASQTAHVSALYAAFLGMMLSAGVPLLPGSPLYPHVLSML